MSLEELKHGNHKDAKIAQAMFPLLVNCYVRGRDTVTYEDIGDRLNGLDHLSERVNRRKLGEPLNIIGNAVLDVEQEWDGGKIPPITALVVRKDLGHPPLGGGNQFVESFWGCSEDDVKNLKKGEWDDLFEQIYDYSDWEEVLVHCELVKGTHDHLKKIIARQGRGRGESREHRDLANFVAKHPQVVNLPESTKQGRREVVLRSDDTPDVLFQNGAQLFAVEVKSRVSDGNEYDLRRGIYQCVKYRAVLRAQQKADGKDENAEAVLVTGGKFPKKLRREADILGVKVFDSVVPE
ncbi:MAG: hypothetical protein MPK06_03685 [Alphaproteobacteria bacterium]|nr:hypothetical protein [Alphaproteobacteria bacterium]MDA8003810.1 hypothetical protein [Alphaproteobacteria bacterium]MDA8005629.1 hypothetical protein [Alphaproteobacteria bacterium]MDA8013347.1 hypothetical protein [Alphaproteobacteria bacterium]